MNKPYTPPGYDPYGGFDPIPAPIPRRPHKPLRDAALWAAAVLAVTGVIVAVAMGWTGT